MRLSLYPKNCFGYFVNEGLKKQIIKKIYHNFEILREGYLIKITSEKMDSIIKPEYETLIFQFRTYKVMIDADLAMLYDVPTKRLKEQVKRNIKRFPSDFMFELSKNEKDELVANCDRLAMLKHSSINPLAFTEQGVAMLSSVLRSEKAIIMNIEIMRAFARYRGLMKQNKELKVEVMKLDAKLNRAFKYLLERIDALHQKSNEPRQQIGYKREKAM